MSTLTEAMKNSISVSAVTIAGTVSRYYYARAPQNTSYPYVVFFLISDTYEDSDTQIRYSDVKLQFNVYDNLNDYGTRCNTIVQEIQTYYDLGKDNLIVSGYPTIYVVRDFVLPPREVEDVWQASIQYNCHMENWYNF